jgi:RES domain-containing protein
VLKLYRICRNVYAPQDPTGAALTPGRWHVFSERVLYTCSSLAMCVLELKANSVSFSAIRHNYHFIEIELNESKIKIDEVPDSFYSSKGWITNRKLTQKYGDSWYSAGKSALLKVRSAVLPKEFNYIINTTHSDFSGVNFPKPVKVPLDSRVN